MRAITLAIVLVGANAFAAKPWKPHPIKVIPGVPLRAEDIKPYTPPKPLPEVTPEPSEHKVVKVTTDEATVNVRPYSSPLLGNVAKDARLPIRGIVKQKSGCKTWYALDPFGYLCFKDAVPVDDPPTTEPVLKVKEGMRVPFQYVMALIKEGDKIPMWASLDDLKKGVEPERQIERGDTIAVERPFKWDGTAYWISVEGKVIQQKGLSMMGGGSHWHGMDIADGLAQPFGWITPDKANVYDAFPDPKAKLKPYTTIGRRARVNIAEERLIGRKRWLRITLLDPPPPITYGDIFDSQAKKKPEGETETATEDNSLANMKEIWISADAVNEVRKLERPKTVPEGVTRWIDVDLGEQVLVLYDADKPIWATLTSSGRAIPTPMGTYPVWAKAAAISMKSQPYEDKSYFVNKVPWSTFFQWHNAIHGAYWHDRFGTVKSHGCVNVAPMDAKHVFEWVTPALPPGWTGFRPENLLQSPTVVVRNSHLAKQFRQDRPIGPPDKELESQRVAEADARRAEEAAAKPPEGATPAPAPTTPAPTPAPTTPAP